MKKSIVASSGNVFIDLGYSKDEGGLVNKCVNRHQAAILSFPTILCFTTPSTNVFP